MSKFSFFSDFTSGYLSYYKKQLSKPNYKINYPKYNVLITLITLFFGIVLIFFGNKFSAIPLFVFSFVCILISYFSYKNIYFNFSILFVVYGSIVLVLLETMFYYHIYPLVQIWFLIVVFFSVFFLKKYSFYTTILVFLMMEAGIELNKWAISNNVLNIGYSLKYFMWLNFINFTVPIFFIFKTASDFISRIDYKQSSLEKAQLYKDQFYNQVSHEIRTPMNAIVGLLDLLRKTPQTKVQRQYTNIIFEASKNLMNLLKDLLDYSKIKSQKFSLNLLSFNLKSQIEITYNIYKNLADEKNLEFSYFFDDKINPHCISDSYRIGQILNNLTSNAIKYTEKGMVKIQLDLVSSTSDKQVVRFSVIDTGRGIKEAHQKDIFDEFFNNNLDYSFDSIGLGLTVSNSLVSLLGGELRFVSKENEGSEFYFELPLEISKSADKNSNVFKSKIEQSTILNGKKILIVEDNHTNMLLAKSILKRHKVVVFEAKNGKEAIYTLSKNSDISLILLDIRMPDMDGFECVKIIRQQLNQLLPIIALSANSEQNIKEKCYSSGFNDYLCKPIDEEILINKLLLFF